MKHVRVTLDAGGREAEMFVLMVSIHIDRKPPERPRKPLYSYSRLTDRCICFPAR